MNKFLLLVLGVMVSMNVYAADTYVVDNTHSQIGFAVKHMMVGTTRGTFNDYTASVTYDPADLASFKAEATIQVKSIDTNNDKRDEHLRGADFFDAAQFSTISFVSKSISGEDGMYNLIGDLTIHGVTKEVDIPVDISGPVQSPMGGMVIGLSGELEINRQDFDVKWNKNLDAGGLMVSDDVLITIELEAIKK